MSDLFFDAERKRLLWAGYRPSDGTHGGPHWVCPDGVVRVQDEAVLHLDRQGEAGPDSEGGEAD